MSRRPLLAAAVVALTTVVSTAAPASADGDQPGQSVESSATALPGGATLVTDTVLDAAGRIVSVATQTVRNGSFRAAADDHMPFACVSEGYRSGFTAYPRKEALYQGPNDFAQALFFPYSLQGARDGGAGQPRTQQWLVCAVGGADPNNGSRITKAGPGIAYRDAGATWRLGQAWREGSTPANYTVSLGFQTEGPVKVSGGISQTPQHKLKGSPRPPQHDREMDGLARNGANGWWEHACEPHCGGNGSPQGTSDYQGSVVEGLWEFPDNKPVGPDDFLTKVYWTHHCATFTGICR
jgi:hypothetical protein